MVNLWVWETFLVTISVTLAQGHQATEAGHILHCPHDKARNTESIATKLLLYLSQKWFDCHETKGKHIDWMLGLKWNHLVWPWPWPWPWIFKVKYGIFYISAKNGPIGTKQKANISIKIQASIETIQFDLGHNLDLEFSRSNMEFAISQLKMVWLPRNEKQTYRLNSRPQNWPWLWKVRCEALTGVTSDVGLPSTRLVDLMISVDYWLTDHPELRRTTHP